MRKKMIAANWKMYKTPDQTREFFGEFLPLVNGPGARTTTTKTATKSSSAPPTFV